MKTLDILSFKNKLKDDDKRRLEELNASIISQVIELNCLEHSVKTHNHMIDYHRKIIKSVRDSISESKRKSNALAFEHKKLIEEIRKSEKNDRK